MFSRNQAFCLKNWKLWLAPNTIELLKLLTRFQLTNAYKRVFWIFQFFKRIAWFLRNNRSLSEFRYLILYNLISIKKSLKESLYKNQFSGGIYLLKVNNRNTRTKVRNMFRHRFGVFIVNFKHISHLCSSVSFVNFEHVIAGFILLEPHQPH